jgi:hypothetical protein
LLAHARDEVRIRPPDASRDPTRDHVDLLRELLVHDQLPARDAGDRLHRAVVVSRPESAREHRNVRAHRLGDRLLELTGIVADDEHPGRREAETRELAGEKGPVGVGLVSPHELAAREDDDRSGHR